MRHGIGDATAFVGVTPALHLDGDELGRALAIAHDRLREATRDFADGGLELEEIAPGAGCRALAGRDEVLAVARAFREKRLPCDVLIYLGTGFCPSGWNTGHGSFAFNPAAFPDPKAMLDQLHAWHFRVVPHVVIRARSLRGTVRDRPDPSAPAEEDAARYWEACTTPAAAREPAAWEGVPVLGPRGGRDERSRVRGDPRRPGKNRRRARPPARCRGGREGWFPAHPVPRISRPRS